MKNTKRILSVILAVCMLLTAFPLSVFAAGATVNLDINDNRVWTKTIDGYSDNISVSDYDKNVADVKAESIDFGDSGANLSVSGSNYTGKLVMLKSCLYTFDETTDGKYYIHSKDENGKTVYLSPSGYRASDGYGFPGNNVKAEITVEYNETDSTFFLKDTNYLVYKTWLCYNVESTKTGGSSIANHSFSLYRPIANGEASSSELPGYIKITSLSEIENGGQYLIAANYNNSTYLLYPSTNASNRNAHVAKANGQKTGSTQITITAKAAGSTSVTIGGDTYTVNVTNSEPAKSTVSYTLREGQQKVVSTILTNPSETITKQSEIASAQLDVDNLADVIARLGTNQSYNGEAISLSDCLYTFEETDGYYYIHNNKIYMDPNGTGNVEIPSRGGVPGTLTPTKVSVLKNTDGTFSFKNTAGVELRFNKWKCFNTLNVDTENVTYFLLYRKAEENETSSFEIPGYVRADSVVNGGKYIIVAQCDGKSYALYPSTNTSSRNAHVARITGVPARTAEITFTANEVGTAAYIIGNTNYNIKVIPKDAIFTDSDKRVLLKLTISNNAAFDLGLLDEFLTGDIIWKSEDTNVASVDQNGKVTTKTSGKTNIVAKIGEKEYSLPIEVIDTGYQASSQYNLYNIYINEIKDTRAWYTLVTKDNEFNEEDFFEITDFERIYLYFNSTSVNAVDFVAKPDDGFALTNMHAGNSANQYCALNKDDISENHAFFDAAGLGQTSNTGISRSDLVKMMKTAADFGCNGVFGFTYATGGFTDLTFRSQPLPTIEKKVVGVTHSGSASPVTYIEGMNAEVGDTVSFMVTVKNHASTETITYSGAKLTEMLDGAVFSATQKNNEGYPQPIPQENRTNTFDITNDLNGDKNSSGHGMDFTEHKYFVNYTIKEEDLDKSIVNIVDLEYNYRSEYSTGALSGSTESMARITASKHNMTLSTDLALTDKIMLDFGLPVKLDYNKALSLMDNTPTLVSGTATYGTVSIENNVVTYTPVETLKGADTLYLTDNNNVTYRVPVYPATTVYYEEGFATDINNSTGFEGGSKGEDYQTAEAVGHKVNNYGYDPAYEIMLETCSVGKQGENARAQFVFYGTGVEMYANCTPDSGKLSITLKNLDTNKIVKAVTVNTATGGGSSNNTAYQKENGYSLPVITFENLPRANYQLLMGHTKSTGDVCLDGFRVFGTIDETDSVYQNDKEAEPVFTELRDFILSVHAVVDTMKEALEENAALIHSQAYTAPNINANGNILVLSKEENNLWETDEESSPKEDGDETVTVTPMQDLLLNGPKNELYLRPGQAVVFKVSSETIVQVGLKAYNNEVRCKLNDTKTDIKVHTDMFYFADTSSTNGTVTIANISDTDSILSITKIKLLNPNLVEDDSAQPTVAAMFMALCPEDLMPAFQSLGITDEDETQTDITDPIIPEIPDEKPENNNSQNNENSIVSFINRIVELIKSIIRFFRGY